MVQKLSSNVMNDVYENIDEYNPRKKSICTGDYGIMYYF